MKSKYLKIMLSLLVCLCFVILLQYTYAKYKKQIEGNVDINLAKWDITLNNENINGKTKLDNAIIPNFTGNEFTEKGIIAPGAEGYYDVVIGASNVDVDFTYNLISTLDENIDIPDIKTTGYTINPAHTSEIIPYNNIGISGTILKHTESTTIRIYIKWDDGESSTMDNKTDTEIVNTYGTIKMKCTMKFVQINN